MQMRPLFNPAALERLNASQTRQQWYDEQREQQRSAERLRRRQAERDAREARQLAEWEELEHLRRQAELRVAELTNRVQASGALPPPDLTRGPPIYIAVASLLVAVMALMVTDGSVFIAVTAAVVMGAKLVLVLGTMAAAARRYRKRVDGWRVGLMLVVVLVLALASGSAFALMTAATNGLVFVGVGVCQ